MTLETRKGIGWCTPNWHLSWGCSLWINGTRTLLNDRFKGQCWMSHGHTRVGPTQNASVQGIPPTQSAQKCPKVRFAHLTAFPTGALFSLCVNKVALRLQHQPGLCVVPFLCPMSRAFQTQKAHCCSLYCHCNPGEDLWIWVKDAWPTVLCGKCLAAEFCCRW